MEIDQNKLARLRALEEGELAALLERAATSMGVSERRAHLLARHSGKLKKKLSTLSDEEIVRLLSMLGQEQAQRLFSGL